MKAPEIKDPTSNIRKIEDYAHRIIQTITLNTDSLPLQFREICASLDREVCTKFPNSITGIRNFIFLRYICPAVSIPPPQFGLSNS